MPTACVRHARAIYTPDPNAARKFLVAHEAFSTGETAAEAGDYATARSHFEAAVGADPQFGLGHLALAEAMLFTDHTPDQRQRHLAAAVVLLPDNPRAHLLFAGASAEIEAHEVAERHWRCALKLKPSLVEAHAELARHYLAHGQAPKAEKEARAALALEGDKYGHFVLLGRALEAQGRSKAAGAALEQAAEKVGRSAALYRQAARLYENGNAEDDAARMRAVADRLDPPSRPRDLRPLRKARRRSRKKRRK